MVVLNKGGADAGLFVPGFLVEAFVKKSARVTEDAGLDNQDIGKICFNNVHRQNSS